jgi:nucleotide-binding universal stress UspA family protein
MMRGSKSWSGFRSVLCAVDFSALSQRALQYAEAVAGRGKAPLQVLYVNDPLLIAAAAAALHDWQLAKRSAGELRRFVDETVVARMKQRPRLKSSVSVGDPSDEILKAVSRNRADLIVLGTHGLTGADRLLMGSTTLSVLQRARVPVLAVPRATEGLTAPLPLSWPGPTVLAAVDLEPGVTEEVERAARIAEWFGSSLVLAHVVSEIATPAWLRADLSAHDRIRIAQAEQEMRALAALVQRRVKTDVRVVCGNAADEIAALASAEGTRLLLTGLRDRRGWFGAKRGTVSYHVLSHAVTPVLACPPGWWPR